MRNGELSPNFREQALETLKKTSADDPLDVFIVGGGVTGAGSAFDAATRGLKVGVVDAKDWASGTSSRSSKLMHGGLRRSEEHTSELQSRGHLVCRLLLEKKKQKEEQQRDKQKRTN